MHGPYPLLGGTRLSLGRAVGTIASPSSSGKPIIARFLIFKCFNAVAMLPAKTPSSLVSPRERWSRSVLLCRVVSSAVRPTIRMHWGSGELAGWKGEGAGRNLNPEDHRCGTSL